jgi:hypothetical protein
MAIRIVDGRGDVRKSVVRKHGERQNLIEFGVCFVENCHVVVRLTGETNNRYF